MLTRGKRAIALVMVNSFAMAYCVPKRARRSILNRAGHDIGAATVSSGSIIRAKTLTIGDGSFLNHGLFFDSGPVTLGSNVFVGPGVVFASSDHEAGTPEKRAGADVARPITVGDGAWIGAGATILGGVDIAAGCIIAAGAVITKTTAPHGLYAGVPARRVKDLPQVVTG